MVHPSGDFDDELERNDARRFDPEEGVTVAVWNRLPGDLNDVAEALRDYQAKTFVALLQHGVGCSGGAVHD